MPVCCTPYKIEYIILVSTNLPITVSEIIVVGIIVLLD